MSGGTFITSDWELIKTFRYWALVHKNCEGYVAGPLDNTKPKKHDRCSGCGRRVDQNVMKKLPFLIKMDLVNKAWSPVKTTGPLGGS